MMNFMNSFFQSLPPPREVANASPVAVSMNDVQEDYREYRPITKPIERTYARPEASNVPVGQGLLTLHPDTNRSTGVLTGQVWPKSRMLFAIVSKMSKEGILTG